MLRAPTIYCQEPFQQRGGTKPSLQQPYIFKDGSARRDREIIEPAKLDTSTSHQVALEHSLMTRIQRRLRRKLLGP